MPISPKIKVSAEGLELSKFIQGYWRLDQWSMSSTECLSFLKQHLELGVTTVDHAHVYGSPPCEQLFGNVLKLEPSIRDKIEIISKCGINLDVDKGANQVPHYNSDAKNITQSVETSLKRLQTDYLDVLLLHRPDFLMDSDEISETFTKLKSEGKIKYFGVSNFSPSQFSLLQSRLDFPLVTNQIEINPINLEPIQNGTLDHLQQHRVKPMAWSCLSGGRIFSENSNQMERVRNCLKDIADEVGASSIEQVIYAWVMMLPSKPMILIGSGKIQRVKKALNSQDIFLTREQWYRVWVASTGCNVP